MANITQLINNIRTAVFGKDVRESIASAIEQTYEDASEQGNANMEVVDARGTFDTLKKRLDNSDNTKSSVTQLNNLQNQINVEKARIDELSTLEEGSTTGDAELIDIRTGFDGEIYSSAGNSTRNQVLKVDKNVKSLFNRKQLYDKNQGEFLNGYYDASGNFISNANLYGLYIEVEPNTTYTIAGVYSYSALLTINKTWIESYINTSASGTTITTSATGKLLYIATSQAGVDLLTLTKGSSKLTDNFKDYNEIFTDLVNLSEVNKLAFEGDVSVESTNFVKRLSNQLINKDIGDKGYRYNYSTGNKETDSSYTTFKFLLGPNKTVSLSGMVAHICQWDYKFSYIKGSVLSSDSSTLTLTTDDNCKFLTLSIANSKLNTAMMNYGSSVATYDDYCIEIPNLRNILDYSIFKYPYIKDKKVLCNGANNESIAYYAGVDCGKKVNKIETKFIFEENTTSGVVALIINPNGVSTIKNITDLSLHLTLTNQLLKVDILGKRFGDEHYYYQNLINQAVSLSLDGITENTLSMEANLTSNVVSVVLNGTTYTGTFTPDENITGLNDVCGNYATFEFYAPTSARESYAMPQFTMFKVKNTSDSNYIIYDYFDREDGQLSVSPQGINYHLISNYHKE